MTKLLDDIHDKNNSAVSFNWASRGVDHAGWARPSVFVVGTLGATPFTGPTQYQHRCFSFITVLYIIKVNLPSNADNH